eukprot:TRINITY_DN11723_c0_g2_i2.p2 TRINITY_DN11723_c0_g2~~TRINITY_DN11723_c0_g2_i2.p2  ORF type:complete len:304 (+),score=59.66 TRINITY_DN11723_c0_g2_i2:1787-2698(+)
MMPLRYLLVALTGLLLVSARPGVLRKLRDYDLDAMLSRMKQPNYDVRTDTQAFEIMADAFSDYETLPLEDKLKRWEIEFEWRIRRHEPSVNKLLFEKTCFMPPKSLVVDSGANVGSTGLTLAMRWVKEKCPNKPTLLMVEPDEVKVAWIKSKAARENITDRVTVVQAGLWSYHTRANLRHVDHAGMWEVIPDVADGPLELFAISDVIKMANLADHTFELWHLDVEGSERAALQGLGQHQPAYIIMEVVHDDGKLSAQDYIQKDLGYVNKGKYQWDVLFEHVSRVAALERMEAAFRHKDYVPEF